MPGLARSAPSWARFIGAWATCSAAVEAFERQVLREYHAWRRALRQECLHNIAFNHELAAGNLGSFDTRVLHECSAHAAAFSGEVLQRVIWARTANEK